MINVWSRNKGHPVTAEFVFSMSAGHDMWYSNIGTAVANNVAVRHVELLYSKTGSNFSIRHGDVIPTGAMYCKDPR